jgi:parallel beta-helix repeat protein
MYRMMFQRRNTHILLMTMVLSFLLFQGSISSIEVQSFHDGRIIYVDISYPGTFSDGSFLHPFHRIQEALCISQDGDTISVNEGMYNESFTITTSVLLLGNDQTVINGDYHNTVICIQAEGVTLENLRIQYSGGEHTDAGIHLNASQATLVNCTFWKTKTGLYISNSSSLSIDNCTFQNNGKGLFLQQTTNVSITGCIFSKNSIGLATEEVSQLTLRNCYFHTNGISGLLTRSHIVTMTQCNISDNSVNLGGLFIDTSSTIIIDDCIFYHNGAAISLSSSHDISITRSSFCHNTHFALSLRTVSRDVNVSACTIAKNLHYGAYVEKQNQWSITSCNIYGNILYGVYAKDAECHMENNWWGSPRGPSFTELGPGDRITWIPGKTQYYPWLKQSLTTTGSTWHTNPPYLLRNTSIPYLPSISLPGNDSDHDAVPDWWEEKYGYDPLHWDDHRHLDPDKDGLSNLEECFTDPYGSNPFHQDIFLELDWMESQEASVSNGPPSDLIDDLIEVYQNHNISLHIDCGQWGGGGEIPACNGQFSYIKLQELYWIHFLENNPENPRKGIFHYGIICNYCPDLNFPFFGWDGMDSFAISAQWLQDVFPWFSRGRLIVGAISHHLGHTLGLIADTYGGIDNVGTSKLLTVQWWQYKNYVSCMNYFYKYWIFSFSDGTHGRGDFDDWIHINLAFFKETTFQ